MKKAQKSRVEDYGFAIRQVGLYSLDCLSLSTLYPNTSLVLLYVFLVMMIGHLVNRYSFNFVPVLQDKENVLDFRSLFFLGPSSL